MAPILIDNRGLIKLGFISVLTTVLVFVSGFLFGHQRATTFYQDASEIASLSLPEKVASSEYEFEPQAPEVIEAGAEIDVDQPTAQTEAITRAISKASIKVSGPEVSKNTSTHAVVVKPLATNTYNVQHNSLVSNKHEITASHNITTDIVMSVNDKNHNHPEKENASMSEIQNQNHVKISKKAQQALALSFTPEELSKIKYSIQVGMFGRLVNAENMIEKLRQQHLDAYVSDYTNKENETRYNVRFGHFMDKQSAVNALTDYMKNQKGDGYLVRFSVKNMINIAATENIKQPATIKQTDEKILPEQSRAEMLQSKKAQDKVSQVDILNASDTVTN